MKKLSIIGLLLLLILSPVYLNAGYYFRDDFSTLQSSAYQFSNFYMGREGTIIPGSGTDLERISSYG